MSKENYIKINKKNLPIDISKYRDEFYNQCKYGAQSIIEHFGYDKPLIYQEVLQFIHNNRSNAQWSKIKQPNETIDYWTAEQLIHKLRKFKKEIRKEKLEANKKIFGDFSQEKKIIYQVFDKPPIQKPKFKINNFIGKLHVLSEPKKIVLLGYIYNEFKTSNIAYTGVYDVLKNDKVTVYDINQLIKTLEEDNTLNTKLKTLVLKINQNILAIL